MTETLYNKVIKVSGVYGIEETNLTKNRGKQLIATNKKQKNQEKRYIKSIINNVSLLIMSHDFKHQPGTMSKEQ